MGSSLNIYEQQKKNRRATYLVLTIFILFFLFLGLGIDVFMIDLEAGDYFIPFGTIFSGMIGAFVAYIGYKDAPNAVISSTYARPVDIANFKEKQFDNIVEEMAIAAGITKPKAFIVEDEDPNAFAAGTSPVNSIIAVTSGLLNVLNREELQGVVGHEMSHIRNHDTRVMTLVAALVGAIALLSDWAGRSMRYTFGKGLKGKSTRRAGGSLFLILWIIGIILAPIIAQILAMMVSRKREYLADASSAELTRNPHALAEALKKIEFAVQPTRSISYGTAHLCIADPRGRQLNNREGFFADLFSTHPPMVKRISALHQMAYLYKKE
jgi:heat shock protein HtpX